MEQKRKSCSEDEVGGLEGPGEKMTSEGEAEDPEETFPFLELCLVWE